MNLNESDTISYFYYIFINEQPRSPFLRYSSQRVEQPSFSNRIDEHGYIYLKVITLSGVSPTSENICLGSLASQNESTIVQETKTAV